MHLDDRLEVFLITNMGGGQRGHEIRSQKAKSKDYELGYEAGSSAWGRNPREINPETSEKSCG